ncbi:rDNA transcriptional regulator pol5-like [Macadamia integrifolia]|uniref:rDNA transcriptional regulator pol5-like n=1 Tax=Macadamia integrifolia TaxID=60698 RepID=UPI001C50226E|nr:rDNA transcriptional regulator pol5-like [Macadamia integrifolia]XP_042494594.1 rDNA transcriptional regulator pol5-like [Macadamia integrifolia]XP_042494595.1 rDNA transcriptional regulator pol5-like [Macadamia integrifolia]XP_042494596.1 rDNA transcriptional regulator pol5-like [Macadamia integrifolia]
MAGKKRGSDSVDEFEDHIDGLTDKLHSKPTKISKNEETEEPATGGIDSTSSTPSSIKPMERRKKRKSMDKERHRANSDSREVPKAIRASADLTAHETPATVPSASGGLPEFHINVFKDLAVADLSIREAAVEALVTELREVQKAFRKLGKKGTDENCFKLEAEKDDGLKNCAPSLRYAIRRLIRGISSSRECARQGFALGLTILVGSIPCMKVDSVMKLIVELLEVSSSMKGQEARDCLLGRLFAYSALARSGRIAEELNSDKNTPLVKEFTNTVISLASKKRYLQEPAASVILDLIEQLPAEALLSHVVEAPGLNKWFEGAVEVGNPDALLLALKLREQVSVDSKKFYKLLPYPFSANELFTAEHLSSLTTCFKESTFCQPRIHSIWPVLVNMLLPDTASQEEDAALGLSSTKKHKRSRKCNSSEEDIVKNLRCFCEVVIEGSLLQSSHDRKHLALDVLLLLLPRLPASCVQIVLSHKLVHCVMDILSTKDSWLYKVAQHFVKELSDLVRHDDDKRVAVIVALQKHSGGRFDCITRTKTVRDLVAEFKTGSGCMLFVQNLMNMFVDEIPAADEPSDQSQTTDDNSEVGSLEDKESLGTLGTPDHLKSWVIDALPRVLKYLKLEPETKFRVQKEIMKFLAVQGLFSASLGTEVTSFELQEKFRWPKAATSSSLCQMCIEQLQLLLANAQKEGFPSVPTCLEPNDLGSYFVRFLNTLCNIPSVSLFRSLSDEDGKAFKKLQAMETRLAREERNNGPGSAANKLHALRYLLIQLLLQILLRPGEFSEAASEVIICCKKAFGTVDLLDSSGEEDESDSGGMPELMDVLLDTLLSLLPQSSAPMRSAVEQVFKHFCNDVTDTGLTRMLRVIKKDLKPARHQPVDSKDDDDEDDEDLLGIEEAEETDEAEEVETGDSDDEAGDSEAMGEVEADGEELTGASDDSDGGMDDDAMFRMDSYLAQIFKEKKNQAGGETAQSQLVLFKLRVLSLLELYLHENPGKPQVFTVFTYLIHAFVNPHTTEGSEQLEQRIWGILQKKIFKGKEYPKGEHIQQSNLESLLEKSLKWASKPFKRKRFAANPSKKKQSVSLARHKMIVSLAKSSTFWILKIIHAQDLSELKLQKVLDIFQHVLLGYFDSKKSQLKSDFVKEVFRRQPWIGHQLFSFLLEKCGNAKSEFRRVEGLDLIEEVLKSSVSGMENKDEKYVLSRKFLKAHMVSLCDLLEKLLMKMPEKQSRRAGVRRFCGQVLNSVLKLHLKKSFIGSLTPDAYAACESQLGDTFLPFKSREQ